MVMAYSYLPIESITLASGEERIAVGKGLAGRPWRRQLPICHPDQGWEWLGLAHWGGVEEN